MAGMSVRSRRRLKHAKKRAQERYGVSLSKQDMKEIAGWIRHNKARHIHTKSLTKAIWAVEIRGEEIIVLYDRKKRIVVTVLPSEVEERYKKPDEEVPSTGGLE